MRDKAQHLASRLHQQQTGVKMVETISSVLALKAGFDSALLNT